MTAVASSVQNTLPNRALAHNTCPHDGTSRPSLGICINTTRCLTDSPECTYATMDRILRLLTLLVAVIAPLTAALKFDLHPVSSHDAAKYERCIRNFVAKDQLVVVTAILDGYRGDGQKVDMHVRSHPNYNMPQIAAYHHIRQVC